MGKPAEMILRENEIRPDQLTRGQEERFASDIQRLIRHKDDFVYVTCPACGGDSNHKVFEKYELTYVVCSLCETMYINPRPTPALLEHYYQTSENYAYWNKYIFPASEDARRGKIFRPRAERVAEICKRHHLPTDTMIEVGAGFGTFCEEMKRLNLFRRVIAVEPTPDLARTCQEKGLEVVNKPIEQARLGQDKVNLVASFEVIEHLFSPRDFLRSCAAILASGGLLVVTCPNVKGFDVVVLQELSSTVDAEHLNYFNPASLSALITECGFEVLEVMTPGKLDAELVRKKALAGELNLLTQPFLQQVLLDEWERVGDAFQQFLAEQQLSSHMWIVARRSEEPVN